MKLEDVGLERPSGLKIAIPAGVVGMNEEDDGGTIERRWRDVEETRGDDEETME